MNLTNELRTEYRTLAASMVIDTDDKLVSGNATRRIDAAAQLVASHRDHYERIQAVTGAPWPFVGILHYREGSCNFLTHLHNGDSLKRRTVHVPSGRPAGGTPPFTWDASAIDCGRYEGWDRWTDWTIEGLLYQMECFNGFGYRRYHEETLSPYLWSFSNHEDGPGKYNDDDHFDPELWDEQVGGAVILRRLVDMGAYALKGF